MDGPALSSSPTRTRSIRPRAKFDRQKFVQVGDQKVDMKGGDVALVSKSLGAPASEVFPDRSSYASLFGAMEDLEQKLLRGTDNTPEGDIITLKNAARKIDRLSTDYAQLEKSPSSALFEAMEKLEIQLMNGEGDALSIANEARKIDQLSNEYKELESPDSSPEVAALPVATNDTPVVGQPSEAEEPDHISAKQQAPDTLSKEKEVLAYQSSYVALSEAMEHLKAKLLAANEDMPEEQLEKLKDAVSHLDQLSNDYSSLDTARMSYTTLAAGDKVLEIGKLPEVIERYAFDQADLICDQIEAITKTHGRKAAAEFYGKFDPDYKSGLVYNRFSLGEGALPVRVQKPGAGWKSNLLKAAYSVTKATLSATEIVAVNSGIFMLNAVEALSGGTCLEPLRTKSMINTGLNHMFGSVSQKDFWRGVSYSEAIFYNALKTDPKDPAKRLPEWNERRVLMLEEFIKKTDELERLQKLDHDSKVRHHAKDRQNFEFYEGKIRELKQSIMSLSPDRDDQMYIQRVMKTYEENQGLQKIMKNTIMGVPIRERLAGCVMQKSLTNQTNQVIPEQNEMLTNTQ